MDHHSKPTKNHRPQPSTSDLLSSAKVIAEAAKATLHHESEKIDKARVAGAGEDLLEAASHYAKLEEKGVGKYVEKAENYLHTYHSSHSTTTTTTNNTSSSHSSASHSSHAESGYGDYFKMAEGFLKKY